VARRLTFALATHQHHGDAIFTRLIGCASRMINNSIGHAGGQQLAHNSTRMLIPLIVAVAAGS
jgi:hypothetical protein